MIKEIVKLLSVSDGLFFSYESVVEMIYGSIIFFS